MNISNRGIYIDWDPELLDADENGEESVAEIADSLDLPLNFDL